MRSPEIDSPASAGLFARGAIAIPGIWRLGPAPLYRRELVEFAGALHEAAILVEAGALAIRACAVAIVVIVARMAACAGSDHWSSPNPQTALADDQEID